MSDINANDENEVKPNKVQFGKQSPAMSDYLAGESGDFVRKLKPYLPQELVGGSVPHVVGLEEEAVWNAASQACATEKVHFVYAVADNRCWYLACPSSSLASNPDSWCPLAAALPGNSEFWDKETVYLYEQEGTASALRWDPDTGRLQVFLGAARTLLPRIQSMDANFVTINPELAEQVRWVSRMLKTEKLSRAASKTLLHFGILVNIIILSFFVFQFILTNIVERDLKKVKDETERVSQQLMIDAYNALQSDSIKHMVRIQEILDDLREIDGTLVKYEVQGTNVKWEAIVPQPYGKGVGSLRNVVPGQLEPDGRIRITGTK